MCRWRIKRRRVVEQVYRFFIFILELEGKETTSWKPRALDKMTSGDSQSSREQSTKESQRVSRWRDVTKVFQEAGLHIKEKKLSWQKQLQRKSDN